MFTYLHTHRVRYRECDPMSFVYHAHYVDYFEAARTEAFRQLGLPVKTLEEKGIILPVIDLAISYKRSAYYDDLLTIKCVVPELPSVRLKTEYEVYREGDPKVLCTASVTLIFFDTVHKQPIQAPGWIVTEIEKAFQASARIA